jgi:hypothetical protein
VQHQPKIVPNPDRYALANPPDLLHSAAFRTSEWRLDRTKQEWAGQTDSLQWLTDDAWFEGGDIRRDVWQLWHG